MNLRITLSILLAINFIGCAPKEKLKMDTPPKLQVIKKVEPIIQNKGSLYSRRGSSLFSDKKDLQRGDIIQVLIEESLQNTSDAKRSNSKTNATGIDGGIFTKIGADGLPASHGNSINGVLGMGFKGGSKNSFDGSAKSSNDEEFVTTVSAIIEQAYQNGNYFIKGSKEMLINNQKQIIVVSGIIRPYDITPENTIYSYQLANLKILFNKSGVDADSIEKPWGSEIIESISPF